MRIPSNFLAFIPAIYFTLLGASGLVMELYNNTFTLYWLSIYTVLCLPLAIRKRHVWMFLGWLLSLIFAYLILAVSSDFVHYLNGKQYQQPLLYFGVGYSFTVFSLICAISLAYFGYRLKPNILLH